MAKKRIHDRPTKKAVLYVRVSTHWQVDRDSLPVQRKELEAYCRYVLGIDDFVILEDAGYSAKNTDRPAYQEMMTRIRAGEFSHLLVYKIDRISRNLLDFVNMYQELKNLGIIFVSKNEQFDTSTALGEAMLKITLIFAEMERNVTSERVSDIMLSRADSGKWNGGKIPMGYAVSDGQFSIIEDEAKVIRKIFSLYESGKSLVAISRQLNDLEIKTKRGNQWSPTTLWTIISNPTYCGSYRYNVRNERRGTKNWTYRDAKDIVLVKDHHEAIISQEQFDKCKEILESRNKTNHPEGQTYTRKNIHIFSGMLICGKCGSRMVASVDRPRKNGWKPSIYHCSSRRRTKGCTNKSISDVTLGPFVMNYISNLLKAYKSFGASTSISTLEKKLLRGKELSGVAHIGHDGLIQTFELFKKAQRLNDVFAPPEIEIQVTAEEQQTLETTKSKNERAMTRLDKAYLYSELDMAESEYASKRKLLNDELKLIDTRLNQLKSRESNKGLSEDEWLKQASYFVLTNELIGKRHVSYETILRAIDSETLKEFTKYAVQNICILDGKIASITFKNGIKHEFSYFDDK